MKKVIFICLLSLSMCLSAPSDPHGVPAQGQVQNPPTDTKSKALEVTAATAGTPVPAAPVNPAPVPANSAAAPGNSAVAPANSAPGAPPGATNATPTAAPAPADKPNEKKDDKTANTTADKKEEAKDGKKEPNKDKDEKVVPTTLAPHAQNDTVTTKKPEEKTTTTVKPPTDKTEAPAKEGDKPQVVLARGFDGPSFIGGIILTLGLLAIGFMGFKYYKNQTERNYHTL